MEKLPAVTDRFPFFPLLPPPPFFPPFPQPISRVILLQKLMKLSNILKYVYCNENGLRHSCARLALQTDAALPFSEQDSSQPGLFSLLLMSESPFQSLCMYVYGNNIQFSCGDMRTLSRCTSPIHVPVPSSWWSEQESVGEKSGLGKWLGQGYSASRWQRWDSMGQLFSVVLQCMLFDGVLLVKKCSLKLRFAIDLDSMLQESVLHWTLSGSVKEDLAVRSFAVLKSSGGQ